MIQFLTDEHVAEAVAKGLRRRGIPATTLAKAGLLGADDADILALANAQGLVIFTQDQDFLRLHAQAVPHPGIVYAHQGTPLGEIIRGLQLIHELLDTEDMRNHVEFI